MQLNHALLCGLPASLILGGASIKLVVVLIPGYEVLPFSSFSEYIGDDGDDDVFAMMALSQASAAPLCPVSFGERRRRLAGTIECDFFFSFLSLSSAACFSRSWSPMPAVAEPYAVIQ